MPDHQETRPDSGHRHRLRLGAERVLVMAGVTALAWCVVLVTDAVIAQRVARRSLEAVTVINVPVAAPATAVDLPPEPLPATGSALGTLSIPRVGVSAVVLHGSDAQTLRRGPGHLENTALPGEKGNVVIAGHRDSFFWPLRNIQLADDIFIDTPAGRFHFRVTAVRVVKPDDLTVIAATDEPVLTLVTCYPFWVFGDAPDRFVVRATAVDGRPAARVASADGAAGGSRPATPGDTVRQQAIADSTAALTNDDEVLVRLAVERYRLVYSGREAARSEAGSAAVSMFTACETSVTGDRATATCASALPRSSAIEPSARTFTLERTPGGWAIRSIVVN